MFTYIILCIGILATIYVSGVFAMNEDLKKNDPVFWKCMEELKITENTTLEEAKKQEPCFAACMFRQNKVINDKGMYDKEQALKYFSEHKRATMATQGPDEVKRVLEICASVNDVEVSDDEKGCERGALLLKCLRDNTEKD